jgi:hypothetical protein
MRFKFLKATLTGLVLSASCMVNVANAGLITGTFSGGDTGEGLDFSGDFEYAINVFGNGGGAIGDATFTDDSALGVSISAEYTSLNWHDPNFGNTANDNVLEYIMQSIRWSQKGTDVSVALDNLTVGNDYSLQLLFAEHNWERGFDVEVEGLQILNDFAPYVIQGGYDKALGVFIRYDFTAQDSMLNIVLGGAALFGDNNPILQGLTLENTTSVPEPSALAIFSLGLMGLSLRRFKKQA